MKNIERQLEPKIEPKEKKGPEISYHFFYSPHRSAKDFENLERAFKKADIYFPELEFWSECHKKYYDDLSQDKITPAKLLEEYFKDKNSGENNRTRFKESFWFKQWEIIHNSKKPILFADIPFDDKKLLEERSEINSLERKAYDLFASGDFKNSVDRFRSFLEDFAKFSLEREKKIKENLDREMEKFLEANPDYKRKKELKSLVSLGAVHTRTYQDLKKERMPVSREFSQLPYVYSHSDEAIRRIMFNKELPDELVAQGMMDQFLFCCLEDLTNDSYKLGKISRKICSSLTIKDIEQISQNLGQSSSPDFNTFINEIEKFGIKLPKSEKEIDEIFSDSVNSVKLSLAQ